MEFHRNTLFGTLLALCLIASCAIALPITQTSDSQDTGEKSVETSSEKELESLAPSANKETDNEVAVPPVQEDKEEEAKVEVKSVEEEEEQQEEDAAPQLDEAEEDDVISQPETKRSARPGSLPQESYYYEPEQEEQESFMPSDLMNDLDLSPTTIAQYLLMTGDFDGFNNALADVLATGIVTEDDIREYRDAVSVEYESLLKNMVDSESSYIQELAAPLAESFPTPNEDYGREPVLPPVQMPLTRQNLMDLPELDLDEQMRQLQWEEAMREEERIAPMLSNILADYYSDEDIASTLDNSNDADLETLYEILQKAMVEDDPAYPEESPLEDNNVEENEDSTEKELEALSPQQQTEEAPLEPKAGSSKVQSVVEAQE